MSLPSKAKKESLTKYAERLALHYMDNQSHEYRKNNGQFFTPPTIAEHMVKLLDLKKGTTLKMAGLTFNKIDKYEPGVIYSLLSRSYEEILDQQLQQQFQQFDKAVFENPDTVGACTFITSLGMDIIGMASYDPRQAPEHAIIGHNCVLPQYRKNGYGKKQILEIIKRLKLRNVSRILASTSEHPFFEPAQKIYLSCGFTELERKKRQPQDQDKTIYYELKL